MDNILIFLEAVELMLQLHLDFDCVDWVDGEAGDDGGTAAETHDVELVRG